MKDFDLCMVCMEPLNGYEVCANCGWHKNLEEDDLTKLPVKTFLTGRYLIGKAISEDCRKNSYIAWDAVLARKVIVNEYYPLNIAERIPESEGRVAYSEKNKKLYLSGLRRFILEARNLERIRNDSNIIKIIDFFEENNTAYTVTEFVNGVTLNHYIEHSGGRLSYKNAVAIILDICGALSRIHKMGIVYGDVSPDNILITDSKQIKLTDLHASVFPDHKDVKPFSKVLTPGFSAPEKYSSEKQDISADIYALGALFYKMITGETPTDVIKRLKRDTLAKPSAIISGIPQAADTAIMNAMVLNVGKRLKSISEFQTALNDKNTTEAHSEKHRKENNIKLKLAVSAAVLSLLTICIGIFIMLYTVKVKNEKLTVWVPVYGNESIDIKYDIVFGKAKNSDDTLGHDSIVSEYLTKYPSAEIEIKQIPAKSYMDRLRETAGDANSEMPDIFTLSIYDASTSENSIYSECDVGIVEHTADISGYIRKLIPQLQTDYYFIGGSDAQFPIGKFLPTGFSLSPLNCVEMRGIWCVGDNHSECRKRAAVNFLVMLLNKSAQELLVAGTSAMPINKFAFDEYVSCMLPEKYEKIKRSLEDCIVSNSILIQKSPAPLTSDLPMPTASASWEKP